MNRHRSCVAIFLLPLIVAGQSAGQSEDQRFTGIRAKLARHGKITEDDRDYAESLIERRNQENSARQHADGYAKAHPPRESTGLIPLTELGKGAYNGEQGGLYPNGENAPPAAHLQAGLKMAARIEPLDREGHPSSQGRIVMCTIGMSNTTQESRSFLKLAAAGKDLNPLLTIVDCAQGAQTASKIVDPNFPYWKLVDDRLANADVTTRQVQVVWLKEANGNPSGSGWDYARFPNLRSRTSRAASTEDGRAACSTRSRTHTKAALPPSGSSPARSPGNRS